MNLRKNSMIHDINLSKYIFCLYDANICILLNFNNLK